jgi:hypothetical protein
MARTLIAKEKPDGAAYYRNSYSRSIFKSNNGMGIL